MKAREILPGFKVYSAKIKVKTQTWTTSTEVTIFAKDIQMARTLFRQQYGKDAILSEIKEVK